MGGNVCRSNKKMNIRSISPFIHCFRSLRHFIKQLSCIIKKDKCNNPIQKLSFHLRVGELFNESIHGLSEISHTQIYKRNKKWERKKINQIRFEDVMDDGCARKQWNDDNDRRPCHWRSTRRLLTAEFPLHHCWSQRRTKQRLIEL